MIAQISDRRRGNRWITAAWVTVTAVLLLTPLVAMQFTDEVNWTVSDFAFAGAMLVGSGIIYELAARAGNLAYQAAVVVALAASVLIVWSTGAVGIIGDESNPGNLLYLGVVGLVIVGSIIAGGRAKRMAWVMVFAGFAAGAVPLIAFNGFADPAHAALEPPVMLATCVLVAMWLVSARLFWSAQKPSKAA